MAARTLEIVIKGKDEATKAISSVGSALGSIGKTAALGAAGVAAAGVAIGAGLAKLASDAAPLEGIRDTFNNLTKDMEGGSAAVLSALQEQSNGMISQRDLMTSYNQAFQLVGSSLTDQLAPAMGMLGKVSAATGQDMGFMMDSLVKGIGRLSPMILDNLGIQVDLTEANQIYAASIGKNVGELTKQEQQTALMNQVMEKLAENTAQMPEVAGTAAQAQAALSAQLQDTKDAIGLALLPVWNKLLAGVADLAAKYLPPLIEVFETKFVPFLEEKVVPIIEEVFNWIGEYLPDAIDFYVNTYVKGILIPAFKAIWEFIKDPVIPIISDLVDWFQVNIPKAITAVENVWNSVLQPVLKALWSFIQDPLIPIISSLFDWLSVNIPKAYGIVQQFWNSTLKPALDALWAFVRDNVIPIVEEVVGWLQDKLTAAFGIVKQFWEDTLKPALDALWAFVRDNVIPIIEEVVGWLQDKLVIAFEMIEQTWNDTLKPALDALWGFVRDNIIPIISSFYSWLFDKIPEAFTGVQNVWNNTLKPALDAIGGAFNTIGGFIGGVIDKVSSLIDWLGKIHVPDINLPSLPSINVPWGQHGGFTQGGLVMTHPGEALVPLTNQSGITALAEAMRLAAGSTFNLTANYGYQDRDSLASDIRLLQMTYGG